MTMHSFITAISPIEYRPHDPDSRLALIRQTLADHEQGNSPFPDCPMVHMTRLQILDQVPPAMGDVSGAALKTKYLLFAVNVDGRADDFLDCLYRTHADFVHNVWGRCLGYPAYKGAVFFRRYIRRCQFEKPLGYAGFTASVDEKLGALVRKHMLADWVAAHQGLSDAELKLAWVRDREKFSDPSIPKPGSF